MSNGRHDDPRGERPVMRPAIWATGITSASMFLITAAIHYQLGEWGSFSITMLIGYGGAVFGWLAGTLFTPFDKKDQERFSRITSALSLFVSGFLLAKLEPSVAAVFGEGGCWTTRCTGSDS
jgi:hypothetical protein